MGWHEKVNAQGYTYWEEETTGEVSWERPQEGPGGSNDAKWEYYYDEQGNPYWHNPESGESHWAEPENSAPYSEAGNPATEEVVASHQNAPATMNQPHGAMSPEQPEHLYSWQNSKHRSARMRHIQPRSLPVGAAPNFGGDSESSEGTEGGSSETDGSGSSSSGESEEFEPDLEERFRAMLDTPEGQAALEAEKDAIVREEERRFQAKVVRFQEGDFSDESDYSSDSDTDSGLDESSIDVEIGESDSEYSDESTERRPATRSPRRPHLKKRAQFYTEYILRKTDAVCDVFTDTLQRALFWGLKGTSWLTPMLRNQVVDHGRA